MNLDLSNLNINTFLKFFSIQVWHKLNFVFSSKGLRLNETTVTQDFVYQLYLLAKSKQFPVKIFESKNEKANGNDLEILVEIDKGVVKLPCQAKIINRRGRYSKINHKIDNKFQIDALIKYARRVKGIPIYLLYNYVSTPEQDNINALKYDEELYGCSIGEAHDLKSHAFNPAYKSPHFYDLHDSCFKPLYLLLNAIYPKYSDSSLKEVLPSFDSNKLKYYTIEDILDDFNWIDLTPAAGLGNIPIESDFLKRLNELIEEPEIFNPKFRILISKENYNVRKLMYLD